MFCAVLRCGVGEFGCFLHLRSVFLLPAGFQQRDLI